jgi:hypothetical protein
MPARSIYVETRIAADLERVWQATQDPALHRRWDLRFTEIEYLPRSSPEVPQQFLYATRIGFGLRIEGRGESVGTLEKNGERTSALRFWSDDRKSLIREGSGYWKYQADDGGVRFLTRYDYTVRFGPAGAVFDRMCFRPLLGRATAWSFDCLRIWLERGTPPAVAIAAIAACATSRLALAATWIYQGLFPKLLFRDTGELEILRSSGAFPGRESAVLTAAGVGEVAFGLALLAFHRSKSILWIMIAVLLVLLVGAGASRPSLLVAPFNPVSLTLAMIAVAAMELILRRNELPSANRCLREPPRSAVA